MWAPAFQVHIRPGWKGQLVTKRTSLLRYRINYDRKKFCATGVLLWLTFSQQGVKIKMVEYQEVSFFFFFFFFKKKKFFFFSQNNFFF